MSAGMEDPAAAAKRAALHDLTNKGAMSGGYEKVLWSQAGAEGCDARGAAGAAARGAMLSRLGDLSRVRLR